MKDSCVTCHGSVVFIGNGRLTTFEQKLLNKRRRELFKIARENAKKIVDFPREISSHCPDF
jgi:hypothetical protein